MPKYKIADVVVEMSPSYEETQPWYEAYKCGEEEVPAFIFTVPQDDVDYLVKEGVGITPAVAENMVLCSVFNRALLHFDGSYIHSSALLFDGKAYLFSGDSGVGKSTHTNLWLKRFGDRAVIINDDKPSFRITDGKCMIYGTPFAGGTSLQKNISAELGAVVFIEQADTNSLKKLSNKEAITYLLQQTPQKLNVSMGDKLLSLYSDIISTYPFYLLRCNTDNSAVDVALNIVNGL